MRSFYLKLFLITGLLTSAQGFERTLPLEVVDAKPQSIRFMNDNILELDFQKCYSGPGLDGCIECKAYYYIKEDSLGALKSYSETHYGGYFNQVLYRDSIWLTYGNDYSGCGRRAWMRFEALDLNDWDFKYPQGIDFPYSTGIYQHIIIDDSIYGYHGKPLCKGIKDNFYQNDTLYYYRMDLFESKVEYQDTLILPFTMYSPGSGYHLESTGQNIIFYDSALVYHSPGRSVPDSVVIDSTIWGVLGWKPNRGNWLRHYQAFTRRNAIPRHHQTFWDTLNYYQVDRWIDIMGNEVYEYLPKISGYQDRGDYKSYLFSRQGDSIINIGIFPSESSWQRIELFRIVNGAVVNQVSYVAPTNKTYSFQAISSDSKGNFYLAGNLKKKGNRSYWYPDLNSWGSYNVLLLKIDEHGNSRDFKQEDLFSLKTYPDRNSTFFMEFKFRNPRELMNYKIIDVSGRTFWEGTALSADVLDLSNLEKGLYYFLLWDSKDNYVGEQVFQRP